MLQNYLILIAIIELLFLYLIVYSIKMVRKRINKKIEVCEELISELPDSCRKLRKNMRKFNLNLKKRYVPEPLSTSEISSIFSEIATNFFKLKLPVFSFDKKFILITTLFKLWKIRHRIVATFAQRFLRSTY